MNYTEMVSETWRHRELGESPNDYRELVRYATLAASSHNTQPWIFKLEPKQIQVLPDLSRRCPAVDPDDHHLYASLGCATENLLLAAQAAGLKGDCHIQSSSAIAVIHSEADDIPHWIEAGRCYQRLALQAAALDLRTAFINQPVEVATLRPEFARTIGIGGRRPDLVVRIGHGPQMPRSLRRPIEEVTSE